MAWTGATSSREGYCGRWPKSSGKTPMVRPFVYPALWRTPRPPAPAFVSVVRWRLDRGSPSSGSASNSPRSPRTAAAMAGISSWASDARQKTRCTLRHPVPLRCRQDPQQSQQLHRRVRLVIRTPPSIRRFRSLTKVSKLSRLRRKSHFPTSETQPKIRARPLVPKGKLCNRKRSFPISGAANRTAANRTKMRPQSP